MEKHGKSADFPELIFAIAGPIGVNITAISDSLQNALTAVRYETYTIHLTDEMLKHALKTPIQKPTNQNYYDEASYKINYANQLCFEAKDSATLARIALQSIWTKRNELTRRNPSKDEDVTLPTKPTAYLIRQLKRPAEVALLRKVYGKQFVLISAYGPKEQRLALLEERIRRSAAPSTPSPDISYSAMKLVERDASEDHLEYGQHLRDTFHLADVFINGLSRPEMDSKLDRFIQAFFGRTDIAPTKEEYGMYAAKSASLRSSDLSRQVGAAIFTDDGELITQGCNEVPKAMGGTYWDTEEPDYRDVRLGYDPNDMLKKEILGDVLEKLSKAGLLSEETKKFGPPSSMVDILTRKKGFSTEENEGPLANSLVMDLTEFGRVVHAEMCAICDAARLGRSVKGATLYCTTFPCHNCTKHILAAGVRRVIYMEPYPKSRAKDLHQNEIEIESASPGRVSFLPFLGISPLRYRDIFQKAKRKNLDGTAKRWIADAEKPMIDSATAIYIELEVSEFSRLIGDRVPTAQEIDNNQ